MVGWEEEGQVAGENSKGIEEAEVEQGIGQIASSQQAVYQSRVATGACSRFDSTLRVSRHCRSRHQAVESCTEVSGDL